MPKSSAMDDVVKDVLSASKDIVNSKIQKETLVASLHLEASNRKVSSEERDSHPFMDRLYKTQDGMIFYSYHDIYAYSHDLVSLDKPEKMLSVSSSELDEIERIISDGNISDAEQDKLISQHDRITEELNTILMEDKMNGYFHQPKDGTIRVPDDKISSFREHVIKSKSDSKEDLKLSAPTSGEASEKTRDPVSGNFKSFNNGGSASPSQAKAKSSFSSPHAVNINPIGYAGTALGKFALSSIMAMGSGLEKAANYNISKVPSKKRSFLSGLEKKNHSIVSSAISDNLLIMAELSSMSNKNTHSREETSSANTMLGELNSNLKTISDKSTKGVLGDNDKQKISEHVAGVQEGIDKLNSSGLKESMVKEGLDFDEIMKSIKLILQFISRQGKDNSPNTSPSP